VAWVSQTTGLETICHEMCHLLGARDLYGVWQQECLSSGLTLMSCTGGTLTKHLDSWHKMQLGWVDPLVFSRRTGGIGTLSAAQWGEPRILYDPVAGPTEFYMLEYRTRTTPSGAGYDGDVQGDGLAVWRVRQRPDHSPEVVPAVGIEGNNLAVWNEGPPDFPRGAGGCWGSGATTPYLRWLDGTQTTRTRLNVHPFDTGDGSITYYWLTESDTWVDFAYTGSTENGSINQPYNTLFEGALGTTWGGILRIKAGSGTGEGNAPISIGKPITLTAVGGPVTIGR
jgi:hypothetical protein